MVRPENLLNVKADGHDSNNLRKELVMLVLARKTGEAVIVTVGKEKIRVMVSDIRGDNVRIGFDAPRHITIHREEIQGEIDAERLGDINYDPTIGEDDA